jgi:hypothetical protein
VLIQENVMGGDKEFFQIFNGDDFFSKSKSLLQNLLLFSLIKIPRKVFSESRMVGSSPPPP